MNTLETTSRSAGASGSKGMGIRAKLMACSRAFYPLKANRGRLRVQKNGFTGCGDRHGGVDPVLSLSQALPAGRDALVEGLRDPALGS